MPTPAVWPTKLGQSEATPLRVIAGFQPAVPRNRWTAECAHAKETHHQLLVQWFNGRLPQGTERGEVRPVESEMSIRSLPGLTT